MKKVINITLGGIVFAIEQDAYDVLSKYIVAIQNNLSGNDDSSEIVGDVERALAEKFQARKKNEKVAITSADVDLVIAEMGSPADFGEENSDAEQSTQTENVNQNKDEIKKRLYRDTDDAIVAGVASGIAQYFEIDPVIVRVLFVISVFFSGFGIFAYIILWLIVPAAETTTQKYAMRGERVTLHQITDRVKKKIDEIDAPDIQKAKGVWNSVRGFLQKIFRLLGKIIDVVFNILRYVIGVCFVLAGAFGVAGLVTAYSVVLFSDKVLFPFEVQTALQVMLGSTIGIIAIFSSFVMMVVPLLVVIVGGTSLLASRNYFSVQKVVLLGVVWIVAAVVAFSTSALQVEKVMQKVGPIEGVFNDSSFELYWGHNYIRGDHDGFWIQKCGIDDEVSAEFKRQLEEAVRIEIGQPIEGYEPSMFMQVFPGLQESDFDGVEAIMGQYEYINGTLSHNLGKHMMVHSAAGAVSERGIKTLLNNVVERFDFEYSEEVLDKVLILLKDGTTSSSSPTSPPILNEGTDTPVACTMDAKICPDGTGVGRTGPNCEFAPCPNLDEPDVVVCTDQMKNTEACTAEFTPVCGLVEIQCFTTPCDPIPETFSNGCSACARGNVISYSKGACEL